MQSTSKANSSIDQHHHAIHRPYAVLEAPSTLGLKSTGADGLAQRILENGLAGRINARHAGRIDPPRGTGERDPETLTLNAGAIASWTPQLADAVGEILDRGEFPVVLGGDCSILLGAALALKRRGRFGLLFIDGHADFYQPEVNPTGEAASMELALATGHGPTLLADLERRGPLVRPEDAVAFGFRDAEEQQRYGSQPLAADILALDLMTVRRMGIEHATSVALDRVSRAPVEGFFIHLDADCLDDRIMPAVDYRLPDGFSWSELTSILALAIASGRAVGLEITIYNPILDRDGSAGRGLTEVLAAALGTSKHHLP
ncbi:MAG: arginase family protein [Vicinamibacterales bacterium]